MVDGHRFEQRITAGFYALISEREPVCCLRWASSCSAQHRYERCQRDITPYCYDPDFIHDTQRATVTSTSVNDATYTRFVDVLYNKRRTS